MIGCTKLLCQRVTVSETLHHERGGSTPPHLLQFTADLRPIVVWNITRRCNLACKHCYLDAQPEAGSELTTSEARTFIADLGKMNVPVLLLSGGEPLARGDIFELARCAAESNIRPVLSTNGTLITPSVAGELRRSGIRYVGVSLDGIGPTHDDFRGESGSFDRAVQGLKNAQAEGLQTGVRFTVNADNYQDLGPLLDHVCALGVPRFCMYHLVYAGRAAHGSDIDLSHEQRREVFELIIDRVIQYDRQGIELEILTVDNHADGVVLYQYVQEHQPERAEEVYKLLRMAGGCSAGVKIANVDPEGNVHPCQFWTDANLGNVTVRPFSEIWLDGTNPLLAALRDKQSYLTGRCSDCDYNDICSGCRIRARAVTGDLWAEDPACYLTDAEIQSMPGRACVAGDRS